MSSKKDAAILQRSSLLGAVLAEPKYSFKISHQSATEKQGFLAARHILAAQPPCASKMRTCRSLQRRYVCQPATQLGIVDAQPNAFKGKDTGSSIGNGAADVLLLHGKSDGLNAHTSAKLCGKASMGE